jgi:hypothetical protein
VPSDGIKRLVEREIEERRRRKAVQHATQQAVQTALLEAEERVRKGRDRLMQAQWEMKHARRS